MNVEVIAIGDELLLGQTINTNAAWLGLELAKVGGSVVRSSVLADSSAAIVSALDDVLNLIKAKPQKVDLVLTGNYAKEEVIEAADLVTEMREIKHPFQRGIKAKEGIDF